MRIGRDHRQQQRGQRVERDADLDVHQRAQLRVGDEHAEQIDLDHRPGPQMLGPGEHRAQVARRARPCAGRPARRCCTSTFSQRRADGGEQHHRAELPHAMLLQPERAGEQVGHVVRPARLTDSSGVPAADDQQDQRGEVERQRHADRVAAGVPQHARRSAGRRPRLPAAAPARAGTGRSRGTRAAGRRRRRLRRRHEPPNGAAFKDADLQNGPPRGVRRAR